MKLFSAIILAFRRRSFDRRRNFGCLDTGGGDV